MKDDALKARIRELVQLAADVYVYGGEDDQRPGSPDFTQLAQDLVDAVDQQMPPYRLEVHGGVTAADLRLNFAFKRLESSYGPDWGRGQETTNTSTATATAYLGECSFLAECFLEIDREGARAIGYELDCDQHGVPDLAAILVRVDLVPGKPPRIVAVDGHGWGGNEREALPGQPHVILGEIPYRNLFLRLEACQLNIVAYNLAGAWQPEEIPLARAALSRHLRLAGKAAKPGRFNPAAAVDLPTSTEATHVGV